MSTLLRIAAASAAVLALGFVTDLCPQAANAQPPCWGMPGFQAWYGNLPRSVYTSDPVPYFALHPPVYYSHPVARPYGYSPFANPPGTRTPEVGPPPLIVANRWIPQPAAVPSCARAAEPLVVRNPYVDEPSLAGPSPVGISEASPQPRVIYPAALEGPRLPGAE